MSFKRFSTTIPLAMVFALAACGEAETPTPVTIIETVEVTVAPEATPLAIPFQEEWQGSEHADAGAPAFRHWDGEDPPEVPPECARCHSEEGYLDYLGADDSDLESVDAPPQAGSVITCVACHNEFTLALSEVELASGQRLEDLDAQARCLQCHQSLTASQDVDDLIETANVGEDTLNEELEFIEIHAGAGTALHFGADAHVGYEFEGLQYDVEFMHVEGYQSCQDCHEPHTLDLKLNECAECHEGVAAVNDLHAIRAVGSEIDYDGDDNLEEGIYDEIMGLQAKLAAALRAYALQTSDTALGYQPSRSPYFFIDSNADGQISLDEAQSENQFQAWTPRLLKAAYNYHLVQSDPGAYAHGGKYAIQLIWDSIESLNAALDEPIELVAGRRIDAAHFAGSSPAFRNWDQSAEVPAECSQCHAASGLTTLMQEGELAPQPPSNGLSCSTCHTNIFAGNLVQITHALSPGVNSDDPEDDSVLLCTVCHSSTEGSTIFEAMIADMSPDQPIRAQSPVDMHIIPVGDIVFGTEASAAYEYSERTYTGRFQHAESANTCVDCHDTHTFTFQDLHCFRCHFSQDIPADIRFIRTSLIDYDGDGDTEEGLAGEIASELYYLYSAIQGYASNQNPIVYADGISPYFFIDTNANGEPDPDETISRNHYRNWTPRLIKAAYNFHFVYRDRGAFTHNPKYVLQLLYDSIENLSGNVIGLIRP